jgi:hypothetical protein
VLAGRPVQEAFMTESDRVLPRRAVLKTAGLGVGAGLFSGVSAPAQTAATSDIWSAEYWAKKGDVPLCIFRKRLGAPRPGESRGRSFSSCMAPR